MFCAPASGAVHDVRAQRCAELHAFAAAEYFFESPLGMAQHLRITGFTLDGEHREPYRVSGALCRGPSLSRPGIRAVPVQAEAGVEKGKRCCCCDGVARAAEQLGYDSRTCDAHQQRVIDPILAETVPHAENALDLVSFDHRFQNGVHRERRLASRASRTAEIVAYREHRGHVVRGMHCRERDERIAEIGPPEHRADVERSGGRVQSERCPGHMCAMLDCNAGHDRPQQMRAPGLGERFERAADAVEKAVPRSLPCVLAAHFEAIDVIRDREKDFIELQDFVHENPGHDADALTLAQAGEGLNESFS